MKPRAILGTVMAIATVAALLARPANVRAEAAPERRTLVLNAGETQVIGHLKPDSTPSVRVLENPHALVLHGESPGELVLLGAERGRWEIKVELDNGVRAVYQVTVNAVGDMEKPLEPSAGPLPSPGAASAALGGISGAPGSSTGAVVAPLTAAEALSPPATAAGAAPAATRLVPGSGKAAAAPAMAAPPAALGQAAPGAAGVVSQPARANPSVAESGGHFISPSVSGGPNYMPADGFLLMAGTSEIVDFPRRLKRISIADSAIADIQLVSPYQLNLVGHKPGFTTLAVWDDQGHYQERQVRIDPGGKQQVMLNVIVAELNRTNLENQGMNYSVALAKYGVSMMGLPGQVATPFSQQAIGSGPTPPPVILPAGGSVIPLLLSPTLTYGLAAQNSNVLTQSLFQYLEQHNLGRILAEPHLLANSGEEAKFLSGGEIPIVIAQALNTSIVFKQFGTSVLFLPTVIGAREIELVVKPEVSQPDYAHGVQLFGFTVPAFITRRAETVVRLRDSQTLIIAGLILSQKQAVVQKVPYLGDLPFAGGLFRNTNWQDTETDLVMAVTPRIVNPLQSSGQVFLPSQRGPLTPEEVRTTRIATPDAARPRF